MKTGDLVEVLSEDEILSTLDARGTVDGLPFMPEMRKYTGRQYRVSCCVYKTCIEQVGMGRLKDTVFLEDLRCDGASHLSCGRGCMLFWKGCWLREVSECAEDHKKRNVSRDPTLSLLVDTQAARRDPYFCQATELARATVPLPPWHLRQYFDDLTCGNVGILRLIRGMLILSLTRAREFMGMKGWRASSNGHPRRPEPLGLLPGEIVRVKSLEEIKCTMDKKGLNKGLRFTSEMQKYCEKEFRVLNRLDRMILDKTGQMREIRDTVILEGTECDGLSRRICPRRAFFYWREAWLERVQSASVDTA